MRSAPPHPLRKCAQWLQRLVPTGDDAAESVPPDLLLGMLSLTLALAILLPISIHYRRQAVTLERQRLLMMDSMRREQRLLEHIDTRRQTLTLFRRTVRHYVADVESRPIVPWTTAISEVSRARPGGVWTTLISGDGPRFKAIVKAQRRDLAAEYSQRLAQSPYVEYVSAPAAEDNGATSRLFGRLAGE